MTYPSPIPSSPLSLPLGLFDPARPKLGNDLPMFCPLGVPLGALPAWYIHPNEDGSYLLRAWFSRTRSKASMFLHTVGSDAELLAFLSRWKSDPEGIAMDLGWAPDSEAPLPTPARSTSHSTTLGLDLSDLNLDL